MILSTNGSGGLLINNNLVESAYGNGLITNGPTVSIGGTLSSTLQLVGNGYDLVFKQFDNLMFTSSVYDVVADLISLDFFGTIPYLVEFLSEISDNTCVAFDASLRIV